MARTTTSPEFRPDADLHLDPVGAAHLLGVAPHRRLHVEGGVARPHGVVLVGDRRAEERHDPVAHDLVHRALVAVDGLHHALEHGIEELARLLGVPVGEQLHRALEVGEEYRHLLALALKGALRGEDLLGEVLGGVGVGSGEPGLGLPALGGQGRGAPTTELFAGLVGEPAGGAGGGEWRRTLSAEAASRSILGVAPGTLHAGALPCRSGQRSTDNRLLSGRSPRAPVLTMTSLLRGPTKTRCPRMPDRRNIRRSLSRIHVWSSPSNFGVAVPDCRWGSSVRVGSTGDGARRRGARNVARSAEVLGRVGGTNPGAVWLADLPVLGRRDTLIQLSDASRRSRSRVWRIASRNAFTAIGFGW